MSILADLSRRFGISNVVIPSEGPISVPVVLDFSAENIAELQGLLITQSEAISQIQGVYIDNGDNPEALTLTVTTTRQRIIAPANSQGFYSLMTINPPDMIAETVALSGLKVTLIFYNVPIQSETWSTLPAGTAAVGAMVAYPLTLDGTSQELVPAGFATEKFLLVNPLANAAITVNFAGGDATADGAIIDPGGSVVIDGVGSNAITIAGTIADAVTAFAR